MAKFISKLEIGINDFASKFPRLLSEWCYEKNEIDPGSVYYGSTKMVWWKCPNCHNEYDAPIRNRANGLNCPYCSGQRILVGFNDLESWCKKNNKQYLLTEWDYSKNDIIPQKITKGTKRKVWWKCSVCGNEWETGVYTRTIMGCDCPLCGVDKSVATRTKTIVQKTIPFAQKYPELLCYWDYDNNTVLPEEVPPHSNKKYWWKCEKGHKWDSTLNNFAERKSCPICSNRRVLEGYNDLKSRYPIIADEWDYEKNDKKPNEIVYGSGIAVWWKCNRCGKEWKQTPAIRTRLLTGCPRCKNDSQISRPEKAIAYYLDKAGIDIEENYIVYKNYSLDIFIPSKRIGIEYDGQEWHKKPERDIKKNQICKENDITLYRIREPELVDLNDYSVDIKISKLTNDLSFMTEVILTLFKQLSIPYDDIDVKRDDVDILSFMRLHEKNNSFLKTEPDIAKEWNYEKNKDLNPECFSRGSDVKVWWICPKGHEYKSMISTRSSGSSCPYCAGKKVLQGFNDLASCNPSLLKEWNYEKNKKSPADITVSCLYKAWWKCKLGHEWQDTVNSRDRGRGCPYCSGRRVWRGFNDLMTTNPEIAKEWDYEKNTLTPYDVSAGSNKKIWWRCANCNHQWNVAVAVRKQGRGCPKCGRIKSAESRHQSRIALNGSFASNYPELAKEWDYEKNDNSPDEFEKSSGKKAWWICKNGHSYLTTINARYSGNGCPYCANLKVLKGYNDLETINPELAKEWDYEANTLLPSQVVAKSPKKINWVCKLGHKWTASLNSRSSGSGCPVCGGKKVLKGFNDLITVCPEVAKEWDYEKNEGLAPDMFTKGSNTIVWWKCSLGHEWKTAIALRTGQQTGCPYCACRKLLKGFNDLKTVYPKLALEWDTEKNEDLGPDDVVYGSAKRVWWRCPNCDRRWISSVVNRTKKKSGCSKCTYNWFEESNE